MLLKRWAIAGAFSRLTLHRDLAQYSRNLRLQIDSIALRQIENPLRYVAEDQLLGNRRQPRDGNCAEQAFDVIFLGIAETAMGRDGLPCGVVPRAGAEEFGAVGFGAARLVVI